MQFYCKIASKWDFRFDLCNLSMTISELFQLYIAAQHWREVTISYCTIDFNRKINIGNSLSGWNIWRLYFIKTGSNEISKWKDSINGLEAILEVRLYLQLLKTRVDILIVLLITRISYFNNIFWTNLLKF